MNTTTLNYIVTGNVGDVQYRVVCKDQARALGYKTRLNNFKLKVKNVKGN